MAKFNYNNAEYNIIDEWEDGSGKIFTIGESVGEYHKGKKFTLKVDESEMSSFYRDFVSLPTREDCENAYGVFEENREKGAYSDDFIKLNVSFRKPLIINDVAITGNTITFDNRRNFENYIEGLSTEDYLGNVVEKTNNEELLYAENENGYVIWGKFPIKELNVDLGDYNLDNVYNAVKEFEEKNLLENTVINKDGNYDEKSLYEKYEQYIKLSQKKDMQDITVVASSLSNYTDYAVFAIEGLDGQKNIDEVWLGKNKNYDNDGHYDNSDNSLIYISDNTKMLNILDNSDGWALGQQQMIDEGIFTENDYKEYSEIRERLAEKGLQEIRLKRFNIDMDKQGSGTPFIYPNWNFNKEDRDNVGLLEEATRIAKEKYEEEWGEGSWEEADKYAREDYTFFEYQGLLNTQEEKLEDTEEKPDLVVGDVIEYDGKQWEVVSNNGFMLSAENLDKNDRERAFSWVGNIKDYNYTLISRRELDNSKEETSKLNVNVDNNYQPIPTRYYEPNLEIDGTVDELFIQARNGYIENVDALKYIENILEKENKVQEAERIGYMIERELEDTSPYSTAQMKIDFLDSIEDGYSGGGIDEVEIAENTYLSVFFEEETQNVVVSVNQIRIDNDEKEEITYSGSTYISFDEFKKMSQKDFEVNIVGGVLAYSMNEVSRIPFEREQERLTLHIRYDKPIEFNGFNVTRDTIIFDRNSEMEAFIRGDVAYNYLDDTVKKKDNEILEYAENENGDIVWGIYPIREFIRSDTGRLAEGSTIPALHLIETGKEVGHADRREVYNAVKEFEERNNLSSRVIGEDGSYEDKDILYDAYDRYLARSHRQELEPYVSKLTYPTESNLAEIYYALNSGLNEQQLDTIIEASNARRFNEDKMRAMRYAYEAGQTIEEVSLYSKMDAYATEAVMAFVRRGATKEQIDTIRNLRDQTTTYAILDTIQDTNNEISLDKVKLMVDVMADFSSWNREQWDNKTPTEIHTNDYEAMVYSVLYNDDKDIINGDTINGYINKIKEERKFMKFNDYIKNHYHREEKSNLTMAEEEKSPKDKLNEQLLNGVKSVLQSENFKNWLSTGGKLFYNNYSFNNALLVWLQKPDATYVMGYEKWKEFGRNVVKGAQGAKVYVPIFAYEHQKGSLFGIIKSNLKYLLSKDANLSVANYRLGNSSLEFTMNRANNLIGLKVNGKEQQIFGSDDEVKRFIDRAIIGKVVTSYSVGTVFDYKDVAIPEFLWVKSGYTKDELVLDDKGNPIKNRNGEVKIINTPERQARFNPLLDTKIVAKDAIKMQRLFDACVAASERKGVPVILSSKVEDEVLRSGANGYYNRGTDDKSKGLIVIDKDMEITERCAVLLHEMGHADLHSNIEELAQKMGEDKLTKEMKEIQAEATAYAVASTFGIETGTKSFNYLAAYTKGFDLQDFKKSLEVIFKETQTLTADIKSELDLMGYNLDLTKKGEELLSKQALQEISTKYMDFAIEQRDKVENALKELPSLVRQSAENPNLLEVLKYQKENLDEQKENIDSIYSTIEFLNKTESRDKQEETIQTLDTLMRRLVGTNNAFEMLTERYMHIYEQAYGGLKLDFDKAPLATLELMKKDFPALEKLSVPQLEYIASSKFISREFSRLLRKEPQEFVDKVVERASLLSKVASKNGTFIEINYCEQWTDKPFFEGGLLCSPKIADRIVSSCERQARGFSEEAEKRGEYFPYTKCDMTIFTPNNSGKMVSLNVRVDIGDGAQTSLKNYLEQVCQRGERKDVLENFMEALSERADKRKMVLQDISKNSEISSPILKDKNLSKEEWDKQISNERDKVTGQGHEQASDGNKKKNCQNRD